MTLPFTRAAWRPLCSAAVLGAALWAAGASAAERRFDLPAQPLAASLSRLAQQAQVQVLFDESLLRGLRAPALSGSYGVREALERLLVGSELELVEAGGGYVVRRRQVDAYSDNALQLDAQTIVGNGREVDASNVGRSTLTRRDIERQQADNIPSLLQTLPGVTMGGSPKPGGQTTNIWGLGDAEDVPYTLDGAQKSGFERYQQGTVFIEPEMIKRIEVEKGPHSVFTGNGGFGGTVHMETKDAPDLLREGRDVGAMLKYGYHSNDQQKIYSGAVFGRSEDRRVDALLYLNGRDGRDMKLADNLPLSPTDYPINPKRLPNSAQDEKTGLFKLNLHPTEEHDLGFTYLRSKSSRWTPFSASSYPTPPSQWTIDRYHFHGKEPLVMALFERFQAELAPLLDPPEEVRLGAEDYWLFLHLIVERLAHYRFLFQDLSNLTGRLPRLARGIRTWLGALKRTLATLLARLKADRQLRSDAPALGQLVEQITLTLLFSLDYQRVLGSKGEVRTVVYQIMMLVAPHLRSEAQRSAESLAQRYLGPE